jgi:hypothetical protein
MLPQLAFALIEGFFYGPSVRWSADVDVILQEKL